MTRAAARAALVAFVALAWPQPAAAHEVLHTVERGRAIAVRAFFPDGEPLAYAPFELYSPADPAVAHQKGRTDRAGYVAFVPNAPGPWRVKVFDDTGHGLDLEVPSDGGADAPAEHPAGRSLALLVRPLLGLAVIGLVFAALFRFYRRAPKP